MWRNDNDSKGRVPHNPFVIRHDAQTTWFGQMREAEIRDPISIVAPAFAQSHPKVERTLADRGQKAFLLPRAAHLFALGALPVMVLVGLVATFAPTSGSVAAGLPLPRPGSYVLNHIQTVPFAVVLEGNHIPRPLSRYTKNAITLLSFFYTSCKDPQGCPLAWESFETVRLAIKNNKDLHGRTRLVFISLDPRQDTPQLLELFGQAYSTDAAIVPWHFLTTYSTAFLHRLLRDMGTEIAIDPAASEDGTSVLNHLLKVFLIDPQGWVREIYSNATLELETVLGDIETLRMEARGSVEPVSPR
jgi:protein SCO1/2